MSPILVRPVREQLEHDRLIRLLHAKFTSQVRRRDEPGQRAERAGGRWSVGALSRSRPHVAGSRSSPADAWSEIETGESVNHLEALAQWAHFARLRAAFHLYVPANMVDVARTALRGQPYPRRRDLELSPRRRRPALHARPSQSRGAAGPARHRPRRGPPAVAAPARKPAPKTSKPRAAEESVSPQNRKAAKPKKAAKGKKKR